jgi:hypothetical protein
VSGSADGLRARSSAGRDDGGRCRHRLAVLDGRHRMKLAEALRGDARTGRRLPLRGGGAVLRVPDGDVDVA